MLSIHAQLARRASESHAALGPAPRAGRVRSDPAPAAATRRALAGTLLALADRVSPEPVERSRWQSG